MNEAANLAEPCRLEVRSDGYMRFWADGDAGLQRVACGAGGSQEGGADEMKPRITRFGSYWMCGEVGRRGMGPTPGLAYRAWVRAGDIGYVLVKVVA